MFKLVDIQDTIRIPPTRFGDPPREALVTQILTRYGNRVLPEVGLVLTLYDITSVGEERLIPGDGGSHTSVTFRAVVYAPALGEVGLARIAGCDAKGLRLSTGFFEDIYVTAAHLQVPSRYVAGEGNGLAVRPGVGQGLRVSFVFFCRSMDGGPALPGSRRRGVCGECGRRVAARWRVGGTGGVWGRPPCGRCERAGGEANRSAGDRAACKRGRTGTGGTRRTGSRPRGPRGAGADD